jgi:hypothetical protein
MPPPLRMMDDDDTETPTTQLLEEYSRIVVLSFCPEYHARAKEIIDELKRRGALNDTKRHLELVPRRVWKRHLRLVRS